MSKKKSAAKAVAPIVERKKRLVTLTVQREVEFADDDDLDHRIDGLVAELEGMNYTVNVESDDDPSDEDAHLENGGADVHG